MLDIIVLTSDKYLHALKPFTYLFNKYWNANQSVMIAGFSYPDFELPNNFTFYSIGKFEDYPVNRWSDGLIDLLEGVKLDTFVLMLEDYWLTRPVNIEAVQMCVDYARQFQNILKIDLVEDRLYAAGKTHFNNCGYLDLIKSDPTSEYHMSLMTGVWRRDNLLKVLIRNESPWQVEIDGTHRLRQMVDLLVLGTCQSPVRHVLGFRAGDSYKVNFGDDVLCHGSRICDTDRHVIEGMYA